MSLDGTPYWDTCSIIMPSSASMPDQRASRSARPLLALDDDDPDCQRPGFEVRHLDIPLGTTQNHRHHHHHQHNNDINNNSRRHHRPSLDSTYSEPSELSIDSGHVREVHHPLLLPPPPPSSAPSLDNNLVWRIFSPLSAAASWRPSRWGSVRIRGLIDSFWLRNKGVVLVLLAMVFGSGMNVAARLMETAGSHGKAMHPFQVSVHCNIKFLSTPKIPGLHSPLLLFSPGTTKSNFGGICCQGIKKKKNTKTNHPNPLSFFF